MRYLLVGNGPAKNIRDKARHADAVIQINHCAHRAEIPAEKMSHVFVVNTTDTASASRVVGMIYSLDLPPQTRFLFSRNPAFYWLKSFAAWLWNPNTVNCFLPIKIDLNRPTETVSFFFTCRLEHQMLKAGMPPRNMPSTGMVAYNWLLKRLIAGDSLDIEGFTFEGWGTAFMGGREKYYQRHLSALVS
jgi:hypothetical protein